MSLEVGVESSQPQPPSRLLCFMLIHKDVSSQPLALACVPACYLPSSPGWMLCPLELEARNSSLSCLAQGVEHSNNKVFKTTLNPVLQVRTIRVSTKGQRL